MVRSIFRGRSRKRETGDGGGLLTDQQHDVLAEETALLERLGGILTEYPATDEDQDALTQAAEQLTSLFLLVIVGEFNAGKSAFINALIGAEVMPEGVTPTTAVINLLRYGETPDRDDAAGRHHRADLSRPTFLDEITVVDTPGTNAIIREHEALTEQFVPRSDLVLFRHLRRPPVHRERAGVHGRDPGVGQEDRRHHQQDRPAPRPKSRSTQVV